MDERTAGAGGQTQLRAVEKDPIETIAVFGHIARATRNTAAPHLQPHCRSPGPEAEALKAATGSAGRLVHRSNRTAPYNPLQSTRTPSRPNPDFSLVRPDHSFLYFLDGS